MKKKKNIKPSRQEAEAAVKTLLSFVGENADRPGLLETPKRVVRAYEDWFSGSVSYTHLTLPTKA